MLTTLLTPDAGTATVVGLDVVRDAAALRHRIGLAGQYAAVDENLTGLENLTMVGRLYGSSRRDAKARGNELLERFDLVDAGGRPTSTYSGGMRRRLDLAAALVAKPPALFLDEPTRGLDPRSRLGPWETIESLVSEGATVLLTTQYLDEADRLADSIAVIDHGQVIAQGTSDKVGGERVEVSLEDAGDVPAAVRALTPMAEDEPTVDGTIVCVAVRARRGVLVQAVQLLSEANVGIEDVSVRSHHRILFRHRGDPRGRRLPDAAPDRLRLLVGVRVLRPGRQHAGVRAVGRLHRHLPADVHPSAFVPPATMSEPLKWFVHVNPFTIMVDAMRSLWLGTPAGNYVWGAVAWALGIMLVFAPFAVARYRRAVGG